MENNNTRATTSPLPDVPLDVPLYASDMEMSREDHM